MRIGGALLAALLSGCAEEKSPGGPPVVPVVLGPVERGPAQIRLSLPGELRSAAEAAVQSETTGTVQSVPARLGAPVEAGALLVQLDERPARIASEAASARLAQAEADLRARRADLALRASELERALAAEAERPGALSAFERLDLQTRRDQAEATALSAEAQVRLRQAELQAARLDLERCRVRSPVAGVVSQQLARIGQRVAPGAALAEVQATGSLEAWLELGEAQAGAVSPGARAVLQLPAQPGSTAEVVIAGVVSAATGGSRNQRLRADLSPPPPGWLPGMAVEAEVEILSLSDAILVPRDALFNGAVFAVAEGKARRVAVQVQHDQGAALVVTPAPGADLQGVAEVVVRGNEALQDGTPVSPLAGAGDKPATPQAPPR